MAFYITFNHRGWAFKYKQAHYMNIIGIKNIMKYMAFCGNKNVIVQHVPKIAVKSPSCLLGL
jgi:hypothetical protein